MQNHTDLPSSDIFASSSLETFNVPAKRKSRLAFVVGGLAVILMLGVGLFALVAMPKSDSDGQADQPQQELIINDVLNPSSGGTVGSSDGGSPDASTSGRFSNKLAGSTETVDENGVVHGVTPSGIQYEVRGRGQSAYQEDKVTLAAIGDQIVSEDCLTIAARNSQASGEGDGYDFSPWYQEIGPYCSQFDLRFVNPETVCCDPDVQTPTGWPSFISPDSAVDNLADQGFNIFNFASNHIYDYGTSAIERTHAEVFSKYPEITVVGSYLSEESAQTVHMIERNGMTFAFLAYTYADNTYYTDYHAMPNYYYNRPFDYETIQADVARAHEVADVVIVCMHWGTEYVSEPNSQQYQWAQYLADMDIDLVIGTHAHIMQPVEYITGPETGNTIPVVFGLSDIVSGWTITDTILSAVFTCDFVPQEDGTVTVENLVWHPTIEWSNGGTTYVRFLSNMTQEEINSNTRTPDVGDDYTYLYEMVHSLITEIEVDW